GAQHLARRILNWKRPTRAIVKVLGKPQPRLPSWLLADVRGNDRLSCRGRQAARQRLCAYGKSVDKAGISFRHSDDVMQLKPRSVGQVKSRSGVSAGVLKGRADKGPQAGQQALRHSQRARPQGARSSAKSCPPSVPVFPWGQIVERGDLSESGPTALPTDN